LNYPYREEKEELVSGAGSGLQWLLWFYSLQDL